MAGRDRRSTDQADLAPRAATLPEHWRTTARRPSAAHQGRHREPASSMKTIAARWRAAFSSPLATAGRPSAGSPPHRAPGLGARVSVGSSQNRAEDAQYGLRYRTSKRCSIAWATLGPVHRSVWNPAACAPLSRMRATWRLAFASSAEGRPDAGRALSAAVPFFRYAALQRRTLRRSTPTLRDFHRRETITQQTDGAATSTFQRPWASGRSHTTPPEQGIGYYLRRCQ